MNRKSSFVIAILLLTGWRAMAEPGNAARGERVYRACVACHSLEPNRNMTGPSLAEVWNRQSGSLASFPRYSPALKSAGMFSAGCPTCQEAIDVVQKAACPSCEVIVLNMHDSAVAKRAKALGIRSVPAVAIDGKLAACCTDRGIDEQTLRAAGLGRLL